MATSSLHLERVRYIQQSLRQVQLRWSVSKQNGDVGGRLTVQLLIIDHSGQREWICQRVGRENVEEDFYDVPSHLLNAGHTYEFNVKLMSHENNSADEDDDSALMQVLSTKTLKFRLGKYDARGTIVHLIMNTGRRISGEVQTSNDLPCCQ